MNFQQISQAVASTVMQAGVVNMYSDIQALFQLIYTELDNPGSYRYNSRKYSYMTICRQIITTASQFAAYYVIPVRVQHTVKWVVEVGELESGKLAAIASQIQYYISNFWDNLQNIDSNLRNQILYFHQTLLKEAEFYSMRHLLAHYVEALPIQTIDKSVQNAIQSYLMMEELETELKHTWFYHVFPKMQYPGGGISISTIRDQLRMKVKDLENCGGFTRVSQKLVFGNSYFINADKLNIMELLNVVPDSIFHALSQVRYICPVDIVPYVNQYMNYVMNLKTDMTSNKSIMDICTVMKTYFMYTTDLYNVEQNTREQARTKLTKLVEIKNMLEKIPCYVPLSKKMYDEISRLLKLYGV